MKLTVCSRGDTVDCRVVYGWHTYKKVFLMVEPLREDAHDFFFSGRTTKVWKPPPPLDLNGSYFFRQFFLLMRKSVFIYDHQKKTFLCFPRGTTIWGGKGVNKIVYSLWIIHFRHFCFKNIYTCIYACKNKLAYNRFVF